MKQILFLEDSSQSQYGGGQRVTEEICKTIHSIYQIKIIDSLESILLKNIQINYKNIEVISIKNDHKNKYIFNINLILKSFFLIRKKRKEIDIIYITTRKHLLTGIIIKIFFQKIKIYYHYHLCTKKSFFWILYDFMAFIISSKRLFASKYVFDDFYEKRNLFKYIFKNDKTFIVPYPPSKWNESSLLTNPTIPIEPYTIAYIGKLSKEKGVLKFIDILNNLPNNINWNAIIAGDGELRDIVIDKISQNNFQKRIKYLGSIETNFDFYKNISIVIIPSFDFIETIGLTALEAIQAGTEVIVANNGNLKNFINDKLATGVDDDIDKNINIIISLINKLRVNNRRKNISLDDKQFLKFYSKIFLT